VLFNHIEGNSPVNPDEEQSRLIGRTLALFHAAIDQHGAKFNRVHHDMSYLVDKPLQLLDDFAPFARYTEHIAYLRR
jgi:hypothetical protein